MGGVTCDRQRHQKKHQRLCCHRKGKTWKTPKPLAELLSGFVQQLPISVLVRQRRHAPYCISDASSRARRSYIFALSLSVPISRLWPTVGSTLKAVQTVASVMEILHVSFGMVKSSLATNIAQAAARHMSLWLVVDLNFSVVHTLRSSIMDAVVGGQWNTKEVWLAATVAAWTSVEVIRYSMYVSTSFLHCVFVTL